MVLPYLLHQHPQGKRLVSTPQPLPKATLAFTEEQLSSGLDLIENGFGKHLTWYAQKSNTTVVVATDGLATFLVQWHNELTLPVLRDRLAPR